MLQNASQEPEWLTTAKKEANELYSKMPVPQERDEEWRYTNLKQFGINPAASDSEIMMDGETDDVIFTDLISATMSNPELVRKYMGKAVKPEDKFSSFHYANITNGIFIFVPDNKTARLSSRITGGGHTIIVTGNNSRLDYIEEYHGSGFMTDVVEIFAGESSTINFATVQRCDNNAVVFSFKEALLNRDSNVNLVLGSFGSRFHRMKSNIVFNAEGGRSEVLCAFKGSASQHTDFTINSHHRVPHTFNNVLAKGTVADKATSVFRGLIRIEKAAQQTDSYLSDHTLLLGSESLANSIPSLQIEANDVKASHGATVGQIDEDQLFYLTSRGLTREQSEKLIVGGFFEPLIEKITDPQFREKFRAAVAE